MTVISFANRQSQEAQASEEVDVVLAIIRHPDYPETIRLCTDGPERLSVDPLAYGMRSTWQTEDDSPFKMIAMAVDLPDDVDESAGEATLVVDVGNTDIGEVLTSTTKRGTVDLAYVLASSPDVVEWEMRDLKIVAAEGDGDAVRLTLAKEDILSEANPGPRMTKARMPGMFP